MIRKLENGNTLITLGEGTVYTGNVSGPEDDKPFGIYFSNEEGKSDDAVIIHLPTGKSVASYLMSLVRFMEAHVDMEEEGYEQIANSIQHLKQELEPMLPSKKDK